MSWTSYLKKGFAAGAVLLLGLIMLLAFGFNKSFDYTGGTIVSVNAKTYEITEAKNMVSSVLNQHGNINVCSFSVGTSNDEKIITIKYQISTDIEATNAEIEEELFAKFAYDQTSPVDRSFITMMTDVQPAYNTSVFTYALLGALVSAILVAGYLWLRMGLSTAVTLVASTIIDVLVALAFILIFRIEISANIGFALLSVTALSIVFNTLMLNNLRQEAFKPENKKLSNAEVSEMVSNANFKPFLIYASAFAVVLLVLAIIAFGVAGSAAFSVALGLVSVMATSLFITPNLWQIAFVRKQRQRTKKPDELMMESETE